MSVDDEVADFSKQYFVCMFVAVRVVIIIFSNFILKFFLNKQNEF